MVIEWKKMYQVEIWDTTTVQEWNSPGESEILQETKV